MSVTIRTVAADELEAVIPVLQLAETSESALRWSLANLSDTVYRLDLIDDVIDAVIDDANDKVDARGDKASGRLVGAATMRLHKDPCEILELAIVEACQGRGLGKQFIEYLLGEARRHAKTEVLVGTANSSIQNIAFYQKCGFRMDHIRKDYFWYLEEPVVENGIPIRDMLVFRYAW